MCERKGKDCSILKLVEDIMKRFVIGEWPAGGYVFRLDKEVSFFGATYLPGTGNLGGMCWVKNLEDAMDIISKYPEYVEISVSMKKLVDLLKEYKDGGKEHEAKS